MEVLWFKTLSNYGIKKVIRATNAYDKFPIKSHQALCEWRVYYYYDHYYGLLIFFFQTLTWFIVLSLRHALSMFSWTDEALWLQIDLAVFTVWTSWIKWTSRDRPADYTILAGVILFLTHPSTQSFISGTMERRSRSEIASWSSLAGESFDITKMQCKITFVVLDTFESPKPAPCKLIPWVPIPYVTVFKWIQLEDTVHCCYCVHTKSNCEIDSIIHCIDKNNERQNLHA